MRLLLLGLVFLVVSGCASVPVNETQNSKKATGVFGFLSSQKAPVIKGALILESFPVFGGDVVIAGPKGYCLDRSSVVDKAGGAFALMASCHNLSGGKTGNLVDTAVLTVTILPKRLGASQPSSQDLAVKGVKVFEHIDGDGLSLVHLAKGGNLLSKSLDEKYWRGGMLINGHIVGLAVYAPKNSKLAGRSGQRLAIDLAEKLRTVSPVKNYLPTPGAQALSSSVSKEADTAKKPLKKIFPRLFQ